MISERVSVGLVGCGGMGLRHLRGYLALKECGREEVEIVAVVDSEPSKSARAAQLIESQCGIKVREFSSLEDCLEFDAVTAIDLAVPTYLHCELAILAMTAGRHVLVEKPIALTIESGKSMARAASEHGRVVAIAENFRRVPSNRAFADWVERGTLGTPYFMNSMLSLPSKLLHPQGEGDWYRDRSMAGSLAALEMGVHEMDLIQYWFGPIDRVRGFAATFESSLLSSVGKIIEVSSEDSCFAIVNTKSGVVAQLSLSMAGHGGVHSSRLMVGSKGSVTSRSWEGWQGGQVILDEGQIEDTEVAVRAWISSLDEDRLNQLLPAGTWNPDDLRVDVNDPVKYGIAAEILDFALAIRERRSPEVGTEEALNALSAAIAILESSILDESVTPESVLDESNTAWQQSVSKPTA